MRSARKNYVKVVRDGSTMAVVRPQDPALALKLTREHKTEEDFREILRAQQYFFIGILANEVGGSRHKINLKPVILCPIRNKPIGEPMPGDSFVSYEELLQSTPDLLEQLKQRLH